MKMIVRFHCPSASRQKARFVESKVKELRNLLPPNRKALPEGEPFHRRVNVDCASSDNPAPTAKVFDWCRTCQRATIPSAIYSGNYWLATLKSFLPKRIGDAF